MDSYSHRSQTRRHNNRKARQREPIVSVFMNDNPTRIYSITVPTSKSWQEFINKIRQRFELSSDSNIALYQSPIDRDQDKEIDLNNLHEYDTKDTNMSKIQHQYVFCVKEITKNDDNEDIEDRNDKSNINTNNDYQASQKRMKKKRRKLKQKRKQRKSDSESSNNTSSNSEEEDSENKDDDDDIDDNIIDINESDFGIDLDIFDRVCQSKKPQSSKKNAKPVYHFHPMTQIQSLPFHLKNTWLDLKTQSLIVKHIDDKYSIMKDKNNEFKLRYVANYSSLHIVIIIIMIII